MTTEERKKQVETVRKDKYKSQDAFAEAANIKKDTYKKFLQGGNTETKTLIAIADALNVSVDFVLGRTNHRHVDDEDIHEQIGLSYEAITYLRRWMKPTKNMGSYPKRWTNTVSTLIEHRGFGSVLDELHDYLKVIPSTITVSQPINIYSKTNPEEVVDVEIDKLGSDEYGDYMQISLENGETFTLDEDFIASAQLNKVTKSIQDLREILWKEYKKKKQSEE